MTVAVTLTRLICSNRHRWWGGVRGNLHAGDTCPWCPELLIEVESFAPCSCCGHSPCLWDRKPKEQS